MQSRSRISPLVQPFWSYQQKYCISVDIIIIFHLMHLSEQIMLGQEESVTLHIHTLNSKKEYKAHIID